MLDEPLLLVVSGNQRYAVAQHDVQALLRLAPDQQALTLGALLDVAADDDDESYALAVTGPEAGATPLLMRIHHADLRSYLPQLALPGWLAQLAHPAIVGLVLEGADLVPLVDLVQLAHQTGHETT